MQYPCGFGVIFHVFKNHFRTILLWLALTIFMNVRAFGQTVPGVLDNYSGSSSAWLNPSNISTTFVHDDLGLMSFSLSVDNNFAYLPPRTFWPSLKGLMQEGGDWAKFQGAQPNKDYYYMYPRDDGRRNAYQAMDAVFPSLMMTFMHNHAVGFSIKARAYTSVTKMPWEIPILITESTEYDSIQGMPFVSEGMRFANMEWGEANLSYSTTVLDMGDLKLDAGVTGKFLMAMTGASININELDYQLLDKDILSFHRLDAEASMALPLSYSAQFRDLDSFLQLSDPLFKGRGAGADIGFSLTYKRNSMIRSTHRSACDDAPLRYYWRIGASLIDFGGVRFAKNVMSGRLVGDDFLVNLSDFDHVTSIGETVELLDELVGSTTPSIVESDAVFIGLPTALSVQFDANVWGDFYCNASWIQPVSRWFYGRAVEREPMLSLTPRFETSFVGAMLPVTLYNYSYVTAGAFVRVGPLTLGTNDLISLMGLGRTRNIDFMLSIRLKLDRGDCLFDPIYDACGTRYRRRK